MRYYTVGAGRASAGVFADVEKKDRERLARAMKAVLLAARAWAKAATALEIAYERDVHVSAGAPIAQRHLDATKRLLDAQDRLAKIEKEVSRG